MWTHENNYVISGNPETHELALYHLVVAPTFACNLRCKHCYLPDHAAHTMGWETISSLVDDWAEIVQRERGDWGGLFHIKGGEPTIMPYFEQLLGKLHDTRTLRLMITTNGIKISDDAIKIMKSMRSMNSESVIVTISMDGGTSAIHENLRGRGTWTRTWKTISQLVDEDIPVHVNCLMSRSGLDSIKALLVRAVEYGVTQVNLLPFVREGYGADISDEWLSPIERYQFLETLWNNVSDCERKLLHGSLVELASRTDETLKECVAGYTGLYYILPDGAVYTCPRLVHSDCLIGHLGEQSMHEVFTASKAGALTERIPGFGNGCLDASCKGGTWGEVQRLNIRVKEEEYAVQDRMIQRMPTTKGRPIAACFSRNI